MNPNYCHKLKSLHWTTTKQEQIWPAGELWRRRSPLRWLLNRQSTQSLPSAQPPCTTCRSGLFSCACTFYPGSSTLKSPLCSRTLWGLGFRSLGSPTWLPHSTPPSGSLGALGTLEALWKSKNMFKNHVFTVLIFLSGWSLQVCLTIARILLLPRLSRPQNSLEFYNQSV